MDLGAGLELRIVRLAVTLGFFWTVIMSIVTLQDGRAAWGYGFGALLLGFAMSLFWWDTIVATGNAQERQKGIDTAQRQGAGGITWPNQVQAQQAPPPPQALPGPSSPIQHSG